MKHFKFLFIFLIGTVLLIGSATKLHADWLNPQTFNALGVDNPSNAENCDETYAIFDNPNDFYEFTNFEAPAPVPSDIDEISIKLTAYRVGNSPVQQNMTVQLIDQNGNNIGNVINFIILESSPTVFTISGDRTFWGWNWNVADILNSNFGFSVSSGNASSDVYLDCIEAEFNDNGGPSCTNATLSLTSDPGTDEQEVCVGEAIDDIEYTFGGDATGVTLVIGAFPTGVNGQVVSNTYVISGTPTQDGVFNYTLETTGVVSPCTNATVTGTLTVNAPTPVDCPGNMEVCVTDTPIQLPGSGQYSGPGVDMQTNMFDPGAANIGGNEILYTLSDNNNCISTCTFTITVVEPAMLDCPDENLDVNVDAQPFSLNVVTPGGGEYSGPGVTNNVFNPASVGVGSYSITYTYENACISSCTFTINVVEEIYIQLGLNLFVIGDGDVDIQFNGPGPYQVGDVVTLTATPAPGWDFIDWKYSMSPITITLTNPLVFTLTGSPVITATFYFEPLAVPLSNWSLIIGIFAILAFVIIRLRHLI